jgi:hypothetical protein
MLERSELEAAKNLRTSVHGPFALIAIVSGPLENQT